MKYEILSLEKDYGDQVRSFPNIEVLKEYIIKSSLEAFIYLNGAQIDLDYFLNHATLNTVGLHFAKGPYILNQNSSLAMITSSDYQDGYKLTGPFYLEKELLLRFLESGELPLGKISGIPTITLPKGNKKPALFLDRDGVINLDTNYVHKIEQLNFFDDLIPIIKYANKKNWPVIVLTNQSGVGRGMFSTDDVDELHSYMALELKKKGAIVDDWFYCPYHLESGVDEYKKFSFMRKPYPGMALKACEKYAIDLDKSFMIGDKITDELFLPGLVPIHIARGSDLSAAQGPEFKTYEEILNYIKSLS
ncbi:MAG: hypothetical protein DRQ88_04175 [Epsilonproteobacteria bacterium]|nr:MAG: hypothetical protein DRQ89_00550 [Campylobacterota bacterium]RLA67097.1 MAG: hypothetical protein DRQ88_04175 [Campylobacterota bacterium]